jgi:hypothetical protein
MTQSVSYDQTKLYCGAKQWINESKQGYGQVIITFEPAMK